MDPWQPLNCNNFDGDLAKTKTDRVTLTAVFSEFSVRKTMDSAQYLSIIGKIEISVQILVYSFKVVM